MSTPYLEIAAANYFTGMHSDVNRVASISNIRFEDKVRALWVKYMLPVVTKKDFIESVIKSQSFAKVFKFDVSEDFDVSLPWNNLPHVVAYQNLNQIADRRIEQRMTPWQIRFEFHESTHSRLVKGMYPALFAEIKDLFQKAGWCFWTTTTGFVIAPYELHQSLKAYAELYDAWLQMRDFRGAGFDEFKVEDEEDKDAAVFGQEVPKVKRATFGDMPELEGPGIADIPTHMGGSNAAFGSTPRR
jgi:hypothetical protein